MDLANSDVLFILKDTRRSLKSDIKAALPLEKYNITSYHYQDVLERIDGTLEMKK